jgi:O-antigen/teichoic acid export membrane protein
VIRASVDRLTRQAGAAADAGIYLTSVVVGQAASLVFLPLVTRFFAPAAFGEYSLVLATTGLLGIIGSVWVRNVGMRLYFDYLAEHRTREFFVTAAAVQTAGMVCVLALGYAAMVVAIEPVSFSLYAWGGVSVLVADFYTLTANTLRAAQRAIDFAVGEISSAVLRLVFTALALMAGVRSPAMLFACAAAASAMASALILRALWPRLAGPMRVDAHAGRELIRVGLPSIPQSISSWVMSLSDRLLLARYLDVAAVGTYSAAYSVADRAVNGLASALLMGAWPAILATWTSDRMRTPDRISRYLAFYILISLGPSVLLVLQRDFVLRVLLSAEYASAAAVVPWVVGGAWLSGAATYLNRPLELQKQYGALSAAAAVAAAVNIILNVVWIPRWGVVGAAVSTTAAFAAWLMLGRLLSQRVLRVPIPWAASVGAVLAAMAGAAVAAAIDSPMLAILAFLAVYGIIALMVWMRLHDTAATAVDTPERPARLG